MKIQIIALFFMLFISISMFGCASNISQNIPNRNQPFEYQRGRGYNRTMNISDEERHARVIELQKMAADACLDKDEGASCQINEGIRNRTGTCKTQEDTLTCTMERPVRQGISLEQQQ
jgi:hypothetical protein